MMSALKYDVFVANYVSFCDIAQCLKRIYIIDNQLLKIIFLKNMGVLIFCQKLKNNPI